MAPLLPDAFGWFNLAAGVAMLVLAVGILTLARGSRLYLLLALFLALRGVMNVVEAYVLPTIDDPADFLARYHVYLDVSVAAAAIAFAIAFRRRYGPSPPRPRHEGSWLVLILLLAVATLFAYAVDHSLYYGNEGARGPLYFIQPVRILLYAVIALLAARDAQRSTDRPRAEAAELVALGFALTPLSWAPPPPVTRAFLSPDRSPILLATILLVALAVAVSIAAVVIAYRAARAAGRDASARRTRTLAGAGVGSGFVVMAATLVSPEAGLATFRIVDGVLTLGLPLLVAYAIVQHRLFDLDVRIRWTLSRTTLAAVFVAVFFVASEIASGLFQGWTGSPVFGILAAGLLVFALTPLQHFAERVAKAAVPDATPTRDRSAAERAEFYREQARLAWADGVLTLDERRMLEACRARLGLTAEQAAALEAEITTAP